MTIRSSFSILGLAAGLACGGGGSSSSSAPTPPAGPPPNTVWVGGSTGYGSTTAFSPATLTVPVGTAVTFSWQGGTHTVTSYAYNGSPTFPGLPAGQSSGTYIYTFPAAGTYYYYCTYHGTLVAGGTSLAMGMAGQVVVQ